MCSDVEIAATNSARLGKSVKHIEVTVKDMSVSVGQSQSDIEELKADAASVPRTVKRVDDLWRHFEGVKSDLASLERFSRDCRAEMLALSQALQISRSAGGRGPQISSPIQHLQTQRVREVRGFVEEPVTASANS